MNRIQASAVLIAWASLACSDGTLQSFVPKPVPVDAAGGADGSDPDSGAGGRHAEGGAGTSAGPGGATSSGGAGAGATPGSGGTTGSGAPLVLDDFSDGDSQSLRLGSWWYVVNDGTGVQRWGVEPVDGWLGERAVRVQGESFTEWGAALGLDLESGGGALDIREFTHLRFYAKTSGGDALSLSVHLLDARHLHYTQAIELGAEFVRYDLDLSRFQGPDEASASTVVSGSLSALQFFVLSSESFEFWLDDVELVNDSR